VPSLLLEIGISHRRALALAGLNRSAQVMSLGVQTAAAAAVSNITAGASAVAVARLDRISSDITRSKQKGWFYDLTVIPAFALVMFNFIHFTCNAMAS